MKLPDNLIIETKIKEYYNWRNVVENIKLWSFESSGDLGIVKNIISQCFKLGWELKEVKEFKIIKE